LDGAMDYDAGVPDSAEAGGMGTDAGQPDANQGDAATPTDAAAGRDRPSLRTDAQWPTPSPSPDDRNGPCACANGYHRWSMTWAWVLFLGFGRRIRRQSS
jgi:hypothetical protein